ncbi:MAG: S26 family signal peptidase [Candidatus Omnitrophota bacterium]
MKPTICAHDLLSVFAYNERKIIRGDVVVFISPLNGRKIAHRVICAGKQHIRTKGDHNRYVDPWLLTPQDIIGQVAYVQRGKKRIRIYGAVLGELYVTKIKIMCFVRKSASFIFGMCYRYIAQKSLFYRLSKFFLKPRLVVFNRPGGEDLQLVLGHSFVVGRRMPGKNTWHIRRPFRLLVDKAFQ